MDNFLSNFCRLQKFYLLWHRKIWTWLYANSEKTVEFCASFFEISLLVPSKKDTL